MNSASRQKKMRSRLLAAAASLAIAGAIGFGAVTTGGVPALAEAVKLDQPVQAPSFADIVEKVSPAVVSVRVKEKAAPEPMASDSGSPFEMPASISCPTAIR